LCRGWGDHHGHKTQTETRSEHRSHGVDLLDKDWDVVKYSWKVLGDRSTQPSTVRLTKAK
jgi:hypothetical protein